MLGITESPQSLPCSVHEVRLSSSSLQVLRSVCSDHVDIESKAALKRYTTWDAWHVKTYPGSEALLLPPPLVPEGGLPTVRRWRWNKTRKFSFRSCHFISAKGNSVKFLRMCLADLSFFRWSVAAPAETRDRLSLTGKSQCRERASN